VTSHTTRRVPVVSPAQLTNLAPGRVVVFVRGMSPVMGRAEQAHKRRDVRRQAHITRRAARAVTTTAEAFTAQAAEHAAPSSPIPAQRWAVDTHGVAQSTNGTHPAPGPAAQEAPDVAH
jgi:type IV secretory pathway TraG/TraD family ATPase VirD4